ncbi:MAG: hypothetical protein QM648_07440 [Solirubrobacterales bacterium]
MLVALLLTAPLAFAKPAGAAYDVTWNTKGSLKGVGPFKDVRGRLLTIGDFSKKFGKADSKRTYDAALMCRVVWKRVGIVAHFSRLQKSHHACSKSGSNFSALAVNAEQTALWTFGGRSIPPLATETAFRVAFPASTLNYLYPDGSMFPREVGWAISKPRKERYKPNPVADVAAIFEVKQVESDPVGNPGVFDAQQRVLDYVWVVRAGLWNN